MHLIVHHIYLFFIAVSVLAGLRAFAGRWPVPYRMFSLFLISVLLVEVFALLWKLWLYKQFPVPYKKWNTWIYSLYCIPEYLFYLYFFYKAPAKKILHRNIFYIITAAFIIWSILHIFFIQGLHEYPSYSLLAASLIMVTLSVAYFLYLLRENKLVDLVTDPLAWISIGTFIYHLCCIPYFIYFEYLMRNYETLGHSFMNIMNIMNCIMYSSYTIAFLCRKNFQQ